MIEVVRSDKNSILVRTVDGGPGKWTEREFNSNDNVYKITSYSGPTLHRYWRLSVDDKSVQWADMKDASLSWDDIFYRQFDFENRTALFAIIGNWLTEVSIGL
jgi:hypothetical protein